MKKRAGSLGLAISLSIVAIAASLVLSAQEAPATVLAPSTMPKLATVDPLFVSYNVEMVEVMGGRFWKPYKSAASREPQASPPPSAQASQMVGIDTSRFQYRPPIDLYNTRLRKLAAALGPSYMRVSGTWSNSAYFQDDDKPALTEIPKGFNGVLTRAEWKGVIDFARATNDKVVTSFAITPGVRDQDGVWTPAQAKALLEYTRRVGGTIAAAEFMNEPTFPSIGGAPTGYDATAFARDAKLFEMFLRRESRQTVYLGPGGVGGVAEGNPHAAAGGGVGGMKMIGSEDILKKTGPIFDGFSYHFYGAISRRCGGKATVETALTADWLNFSGTVADYYGKMRDQYLPGRPLWLTETAEAACGGDPLAGQFVDTFRYVNQLGLLAQKGVRTVMHNTLASSDYGLLDEETLEPRPDFWASLLWKRVMGETVLDPGLAKDQSLRVYAHCAKSGKGGVSLVALNTDPEHEQTVTLPMPAEEFTLTASDLTSTQVLLNGTELKAAADGSIRPLMASAVAKGSLRLAPASVTFLTFSSARNKSCR